MRYIWAGFGCLVGLALGWWVGSFTACVATERGCEVRVQSIEAAGTWVGGVGTVLAVGAAVLAYRSEERSRREEERQKEIAAQQRASQALENAKRVVVTAQVVSYTGDAITQLAFEIRNGASQTSAFDLNLSHDTYGPFQPEHSLAPGRQVAREVFFGERYQREVPQVPRGQRDEWLRRQLDQTKLQFVMKNVQWCRVGDAEPTEM